MPDKNFLELFPLYKSMTLDILSDYSKLKDLPKPAINLDCSRCGSMQTFNMTNEYYEIISANMPAPYKVVRAVYTCAGCQQFTRYFFLFFGVAEVEEDGESYNHLSVQKVGQLPAWSIEPGKKVAKVLGKDVELYKKGLINESQGYGIGAYAYYRRIAENIIDNLLESIASLIEEDKRKEYKAALHKVKKTKVMREKIDLVKDLLPTSLRPEGVNPLSALYEALSVGLHEESDEECLELADTIRKILTYLVNQVARAKAGTQEFTDSMKKLLDRKSEKGLKEKPVTEPEEES